MKLKLILIFFIVLNLNSYANIKDYWGSKGHRIVGKIANNYLNRKTKREINKLLDHKSLALVSTFADDIKSDPRYKEYYTWHYINMPLESDYQNSKKNPHGDLVSGITYCINTIKNKKTSDADKAFYLKLLIHLVGDLHQPLHVGLKEDKGGNDFKVQWFYKPSNLHHVWDSDMIENYGMSYTEFSENADVLTKTQVKAIQQGSIIDWANDTHKLTRKVYASATQDENLKYKYMYDNFETVRTQLQKGGIRLAKILNELF